MSHSEWATGRTLPFAVSLDTRYATNSPNPKAVQVGCDTLGRNREYFLILTVFSCCLHPQVLSQLRFPMGWCRHKQRLILLGFPVEGTNHTHVFRAIMGLYFANIGFWLAGFAMPSLRLPALWGLFIFMGGLAAGRVLSLILDGFPNFVLAFYLIAEITFATLGLIAIRRNISVKG